MLKCLLCRFLSALMVMSTLAAPENDCDSAQPVCGAYAPGDIIIGILLPCHHKVKAPEGRITPEAFQCSEFDLRAFVISLAAIHEIEEMNGAGFIPGVRLGYLLCDTCSYASKAVQDAVHMLAVNGSLSMSCDDTNSQPRVKIILGALYSGVTMAVARLLNVYMVPLVSSSSSSPELSNKEQYPVVLRTIPSDKHQTRAVAKIMHHYNWNWVGVIYGDDEYGKAAFQSFLRDAESNGVCLAYQDTLPHGPDRLLREQRIQQVAEKIRSSSAQVVLLITRAGLVKDLFTEMIKTNTSKTWVASDAWSRSWSLAHMDGINMVGDILGFTFIGGDKSESFHNYLQNLQATPGGYNHFIEEYKNLRFNCSSECFLSNPPSYCPSPELLKIKAENCSTENPQSSNDDFLSTTDTTEGFTIKVTMKTVANALKSLLKCNDTQCLGEVNFPPWQLLRELKKTNFTFDNQFWSFDEYGDFVSGYDLVKWEISGLTRKFQKIGSYSVRDEQVKIDVKDVTWFSTTNTTPPWSRCSESCAPGSVKKILNVSCCYNCTLCLEGTYSDAWDLHECKKCPNGTWSLKGWTQCKLRSESFLQWIDPHPIAMMAAAAFGILLLLAVLVVFLVHRDCLAMRRAEVRLSCVMMAGLAVSFTSVICFMGKPTVHLCRARQLMYGMGFTLCVSCILVKAYRTFLAFLPFGHFANRRLHRLYKPPIIVISLTAVQGIICLLWVIFDSPDVDNSPVSQQTMNKVIQCSEGATYIGFSIMLSYIGFLALVGFLLAFKGRKVPQEFSETGYIIFSMLMYMFVWVCFIPIYITNHEKGAPVQVSAILVSNYGIIFCHFLPKCYEALWGSKSDTLERILSRWRTRNNPRDDLEPEPNVSIPGVNIPSQSDARLSVSSTTPIVRSPVETLSEDSATVSKLMFISTSNEKINPYPMFNKAESKLRKRCRSISI